MEQSCENARTFEYIAGTVLDFRRTTYYTNCHLNIQEMQKTYSKRLGSKYKSISRDQIREATCFEVMGVNFAGLLFLQNNKKAWIRLFTYVIYRAVHLEIVMTLTTAGFLQAFRRFITTRGRPHVLYSDNGIFVGANNIFRHLDWEKLKKYSTNNRIYWQFDPSAAPLWGRW